MEYIMLDLCQFYLGLPLQEKPVLYRTDPLQSYTVISCSADLY